MSHVADIELDINDLSCLKEAAKSLGLEFVEQTTYKWFGRHVGDYPLPKGFAREDLGKCKYALRLPGDSKAYEVGVVERKDGKPGYQLLWDFWAGGYGLEKAIGKDGGLLKQAYTIMRAKKEMLRKGYRAKTTTDAEGNMFLTCSQ